MTEPDLIVVWPQDGKAGELIGDRPTKPPDGRALPFGYDGLSFEASRTYARDKALRPEYAKRKRRDAKRRYRAKVAARQAVEANRAAWKATMIITAAGQARAEAHHAATRGRG